MRGDILRAGDLVAPLQGCRYLIHAAALYSFARVKRDAIWATNVKGTASLLEAARLAKVERVVVTSSSATVGPASEGTTPTEDNCPKPHGPRSVYHRSKLEQERVVLAAQIPTVLLLPTTPVGPGDRRPTPTGKMIVDFMKGRIFASMSGGLNLVAVEDVARAHVLALKRGQPCERYLIGGTNMLLDELWSRLAVLCRRRPPRVKLPYHVALAFGLLDEMRCRFGRGAEPLAPLEAVEMGRHLMFVDSQRAKEVLGFRAGSATDALERAVSWFRVNGYA